jgi:hypothetical protein
MQTKRRHEPVRIELWVWADRDCLDDERNLALQRVESLDEAGVIDSYSLNEWAHQVPLTGESSLDRRSERLQDRLDASRAWAEENDVELPLSPGHAAGSGRMGPTTVVQDVPPLLMIEYGVEGVECVTPHRAGRDEHSIEDRLDALAKHGEWVAPPCQRRVRS